MQKDERAGEWGARRPDRQREGIALVLVLGMLALLMLIGVTFSITMRVERDGAGSYSSMVASKQLVESALGHAIEAIDANMEPGTTNFVFPTWSVLPSGGVGRPSSLAWGEALEHIPASLHAEAQAAQSQWEEVSVSGGTRARVSYLVINVSDMLDASQGGESNRLYGAGGAGEVQIDRLPEVQDVAALVAQRTADGRYETLEEFSLYQDGKGLKPDQPAQHFSSYVEALPGSYPNGVVYEDLLPITGLDVAALKAKRTDIEDRLELAGIDSKDSKFVFDALIDYVDEDSVPEDLASPCTERVPMINEVGFNGSRGFQLRDNELSLRMRVEAVFPFMVPSSDSFELTSDVKVEISEGETVIHSLDMPTDQQDLGYGSGSDTNSYHTVDFSPSFPLNPVLSNTTYTVSVWYKGMISNGGGVPVDEVPSLTQPDHTKWLSWTTNITHTAGGVDRPRFPSLEAADPRFNWENSPYLWMPYGAGTLPPGTIGSTFTPGGINSYTAAILAAARGARYYGIDYSLTFHVSDAGELFTVGELGNLPRSEQHPGSRRWRPGDPDGRFRTIRLLDYFNDPTGPAGDKRLQADPVLDYFTNHSPGSRRRGLVNPNSLDPERLACAFYDMPMSPPAQGVTPAQISFSAVDALVGRLIDWRKTQEETWSWVGGSSETLFTRFDTLSALGRYDWRGDPYFAGKSDVEIEAFIGNCAGLMATRQNMFLVIVAAKPFSVGMGTASAAQGIGTWMGIKRAVVQLQRDPYPTEVAPGVFKCRVRVHRFKWLNDD